jgi:hypothetical protein
MEMKFSEQINITGNLEMMKQYVLQFFYETLPFFNLFLLENLHLLKKAFETYLKAGSLAYEENLKILQIIPVYV